VALLVNKLPVLYRAHQIGLCWVQSLSAHFVNTNLVLPFHLCLLCLLGALPFSRFRIKFRIHFPFIPFMLLILPSIFSFTWSPAVIFAEAYTLWNYFGFLLPVITSWRLKPNKHVLISPPPLEPLRLCVSVFRLPSYLMHFLAFFCKYTIRFVCNLLIETSLIIFLPWKGGNRSLFREREREKSAGLEGI
jgi:hypothetical protein